MRNQTVQGAMRTLPLQCGKSLRSSKSRAHRNPRATNSASASTWVNLCAFWYVLFESRWRISDRPPWWIWSSVVALGQSGMSFCRAAEPFLPGAPFHFLLWILQKGRIPGRSGGVQGHVGTSVYICVCMRMWCIYMWSAYIWVYRCLCVCSMYSRTHVSCAALGSHVFQWPMWLQEAVD